MILAASNGTTLLAVKIRGDQGLASRHLNLGARPSELGKNR